MKNIPNESFVITFEGENIDVHPEMFEETLIYKIKFPDGRPDLTITETDIDDNASWICIPEEEQFQQLAQQIGALLQSKFE
jgi:hypothetical protein